MAADRRILKGKRVDALPRRRQVARWDFSQVEDGHAYLLRRGRDFDVGVETIRRAAISWARERNLKVTTRVEFDGPPAAPGRKAVGLYLQFGGQDQRR
jgi:hypothetical protein